MYSTDQLVSIVIPTYNVDIGKFAVFLNEIIDVCMTNNIQAEYIIVDDCSKEVEQLQKTIDTFDFVKSLNFIKLERNSGQDISTTTGVLTSSGDVIITIDDDGEYIAEDIILMLNTLKSTNADLVYGIRNMEKKSIFRAVTTRLFYWLLDIMGYDRVSSFKCMDSKFRPLLKKHISDRFFIIDKVLVEHAVNRRNIQVSFHSAVAGRYSVFMLFKRAYYFLRYR